MLLAIDIGNTNLTLGLYEGEQLGAHWRRLVVVGMITQKLVGVVCVCRARRIIREKIPSPTTAGAG